MEQNEATAEQLQEESAQSAEAIAQQAVQAERERIQKIDKLTPKGAKFAEMAKKAKEEGTSVQDFLEQVIAAQDKTGEEYMEARARETASARNVGGGDSQDESKADIESGRDKLASEIANLANDMKADGRGMA